MGKTAFKHTMYISCTPSACCNRMRVMSNLYLQEFDFKPTKIKNFNDGTDFILSVLVKTLDIFLI